MNSFVFKRGDYIRKVFPDGLVVIFTVMSVDSTGIGVYSDHSPRLYFTYTELNTLGE